MIAKADVLPVGHQYERLL